MTSTYRVLTENPDGRSIGKYDNNQLLLCFFDPSPGNSDYEEFLRYLSEGGILL